MFSRLSKLAIVTALACSFGLHWTLLQSVAWVSMVASYSEVAPLKEAIVKTFDGKHPCSLCQEIAKGRQSEKKPESGPAGKKFEFSFSTSAFVFTAPSIYSEVRWPELSGTALPRAPLVPPPRRLPC